MFTKTTLSTTLTAIVFGVAIIATPVTAQAHGPGNHNGPSNHGPSSQNKPTKTTSNSMSRQHHRKRGGDANDIDPQEDSDACKWIKKNGRDVKVCTDDDE